MNTGRSIPFVLPFILALLPRGQLLAGGGPLNVRGMGMARTAAASAVSLDAVGVNPARLAVDDGATVSIGILPFSGHVGADFMTFGMYTEYFTGVDTDSGRVGRYLSESDKRRILGAFDGDTGTLQGDAGVSPFGVSVRVPDLGVAAFTVNERAAGFATIPRGYLEFLFYGNTPGSLYTFSGSTMAAAWTREYALSFGMTLPTPDFLVSLSVGATMKLVHGYGYIDLVRSNTTLATSDVGALNGTIDVFGRSSATDALRGTAPHTLFPAPAGSGVGVDIGVAGEVGDAVALGLSVTDIGSIHWSRNLEEFVTSSTIHLDDPLQDAQRDSVERAVRGEKRMGGAFTTLLPTTLRFGVGVLVHKLPFAQETFPGELLLSCDYHQGFATVPGATTSPRFSLGIEYIPLPFLPIRTGISFGGNESVLVAVGLGIDVGFGVVDLAAQDITWVVAPRSSSTASAALGFRFRI